MIKSFDQYHHRNYNLGADCRKLTIEIHVADVKSGSKTFSSLRARSDRAEDAPGGVGESIELEVSDEVLVARVVQRDQVAFSTLYDRYVRAVYAFAAYMLDNAEAEAVVQEAFLRLWRKADQYEPAKGPFRTWFMAISRYQIMDRLRHRRRQQRRFSAEQIDELLRDWIDPAAVDAEETVWRNEQSEKIKQALQTLPAEQRRVIVLAYYGGLSQSTMAEHLGWPLGTVKKRVRLGL